METSDINKELLLAAQSGDLDKLKKAISQGGKVNTSDKNRLTPLHIAAQNGHLM